MNPPPGNPCPPGNPGNSAIRHRLKSELFLQCSELPPERRDAFLEQACGNDQSLRHEIERMLAHDQPETEFLDQPALGEAFHVGHDSSRHELPKDSPAAAAHATMNPGLRPGAIGNYRIVSILGEGGMGMVYRAEQINPKRIVALKVLRPGSARSCDSIRRFELEAQVLGRMAHPNIAHVYEAGTFDDATGKNEAGGQPFLAMELVDGPPLPDYVRDHGLTVRQRIELFLQVCDAVEHAHQRGVIHRDLKPGNILVVPPTPQSSGAPVPGASGAVAGQPKVLDFGIARVTADDWQVSVITGTGQLLGTLAYMSPEQFDVDPSDSTGAAIDTRTDVYSLGVVLFELLTGSLPYDVRDKSLAQSMDILRGHEPKRIEQVDPEFRARGWNDLSIIVSKAIERDRHRRYGAVGEFAADLRRFLHGEPIMARPQTTFYQLRKFARRHTELVTGVAAVFALLVLGIIGLSKYAVDISRAKAVAEAAHVEAVAARDEARERSDELQQVTDFQAAMLRDIDVHLMGLRLREDLIEEFREAHGRADSLDELQREFERHLTGINFTTAAQKGLERNVFERAIEAIERDLGDQPLIKARLLQSIADSLESLDLVEQAMGPQEQALAIRRELLGNDHPDTLTSVLGLGFLRHGMGQFEQAEALYNEALAGRRSAPDMGEDHPDTLLIKRRLANLYWMTGRSDEAVVAGRAAFERLRRTLGDDDLRTIDAMHTMGPLMHGIGDFDASLSYTLLALDGRRRILGDEHPETLISLNNMGVILMSQGRAEDAMPYLKGALEGRTRLLGRNHRLTLQSMANLARGLAALGRHHEAERLTRIALEEYERMYGEEHPHTLSTIGNLGRILLDAGRFAEASPYVERSLALRRNAAGMGDRHPETIAAFAPMIRLLRESGRLDEAVAVGEEAIELMNEALPATHIARSIMLAEQGRALAALARFNVAEPVLLEAHRIVAEVFGANHAQTREAARAVEEFYGAWREFDESEEVAAKLAEWREE